MAEFALNSPIATANLTMYVADALAEATVGSHHSNEEEQNESAVPEAEYVTSSTSQGHNQALAVAIMNTPHINENDLEVVSTNSSNPITVSSPTPAQTVHSSLPSSASWAPTSPQSIPVPTSPQSTRPPSRASSTNRSSRSRSSRVSARK